MNPNLAAARRHILHLLGLEETITLRTCIRCGSAELPHIVAAARPRVTQRGGFAHAYDDPKHAKAMAYIADLYTQARGTIRATYSGPVILSVVSHRHIPSSRKKHAGEQDTIKPDADNVLKLVMDALTGIAYKDDAQVVAAIPMKAPRRGDFDWYEIEVTYCEVPNAQRCLN